MHEELSRNDVQALAHVFADTHHRLAAIAGRVLWLMAVLDPFEVLGQGLTLWLTSGAGLWRVARFSGGRLQCCELGLQVCLVGCQGFFKQLALLGRHAFGLGTEAPGLEAAQFKGDAGDLGIPEPDGLGLGLDLPALLANVCQDASGQLGSGGRAQTDKVLGAELVDAKHAWIVQNPHKKENQGILQLPFLQR